MKQIKNNNSIIDPLESAIKQFSSWRATREKKGRIPEPLWALAISLSTQYGFSKIVSALKLCGVDFKKRLYREIVVNETKPVSFVDCSKQIFTPENPFEKQTCHLEFTCKNATAVKISGLSSAEIKNVVTLLIGYS